MTQFHLRELQRAEREFEFARNRLRFIAAHPDPDLNTRKGNLIRAHIAKRDAAARISSLRWQLTKDN